MKQILIFLTFLLFSISSVYGEPCWGYTVNQDTNECVVGLLYDDFGSPGEYANCYIIDGCVGDYVDFNPSNMNCTYVGCTDNCGMVGDTRRASVSDIGCMGKSSNNFTPIIITIVLLALIIWLVHKKIRNKT